MALGWFNHLAGDRAVAWSGGSEPGNEVNPSAIAAMVEIGIDVTDEIGLRVREPLQSLDVASA
jgi:arsenate reductase